MILIKSTSQVDFVFCAVDMKKDEIKALEEEYAKHECPVVSNNSANRFTPDVPMVVPELNAEHINIIPAQRKRLGTKRGFNRSKIKLFASVLCACSFPSSGKNILLRKYLFVLTRLFQAQEKHLKHGLK